jgi:hypothetical protein
MVYILVTKLPGSFNGHENVQGSRPTLCSSYEYIRKVFSNTAFCSIHNTKRNLVSANPYELKCKPLA